MGVQFLADTCTHLVDGACLKTGLPENGNSWEKHDRVEGNILLCVRRNASSTLTFDFSTAFYSILLQMTSKKLITHFSFSKYTFSINLDHRSFAM